MSVLGKRMNPADAAAISLKKPKRSNKSPRVTVPSDILDPMNSQILSLVHSYLLDLGLDSVAKELHKSAVLHPGSDLHTRLESISGDPSISVYNVVACIERVIGDLSLPNASEISLVLQRHEMSLLYSSAQDQLLFLKNSNTSFKDQLSLGLLFSDSSSIMNKCELINTVVQMIPKSVAPANNRLMDLISQAMAYQESRCPFHTNPVPLSLFEDHLCPRMNSFVETVRLEGHRDEVWVVAVSHGGNFIASASKDKTVCVWALDDGVSPLVVFTGHTNSVGCVAWSPNDEYILSGSADTTITLWSLESRTAARKFTRHTESVASVVWQTNHVFFSASCDKSVIMWTVTGTQLATWRFQGRVQDISLIPNWLVVASSERNVQLIDLTGEDKWYDEPICLPERFPVTSLTAAAQSNHVLVNVSRVPPCVHLWNVTTRRMEQRYVGHQKGRFIVRSSFGGDSEQFILCGSEDGKIFLWSRVYGALLQQFVAHSAVVNEVVYIPPNGNTVQRLASASDDGTVRIWSLKV